jgi:SAM-dependent methyltransferase
MKKWYRSWFNSPYYHILYSNRDHREAEHFIDNLYNKLQLNNNSKILDACCGKGRHSIYLNKKGMDVIGIDLSHDSIKYAKQFENDKLHFYEHDIRNEFYTNSFDYVFNLFTSFGYFNRENENLKAIKVFYKSLKTNGFLLIDFLNSEKITTSIQTVEEKTIDGIKFNIKKSIENGLIVKRIDFNDGGIHFEYKEEVKALSYADFKRYCKLAGFKIITLFGDYKLNPYDSKHSERLIILAQKI